MSYSHISCKGLDEMKQENLRNILNCESAVSEIIGAIMFLAIGVAMIALIQTQSVPEWNKAVEKDHYNVVYDDFLKIRSDIEDVALFQFPKSSVIHMGAHYPDRLIFINPSGTSGTMTSDYVWINVSYTNSTGNATSENFSSTSIKFEPNYNYYSNAPSLVYEHGVVIKDFTDNNYLYTDTDQAIISDNTINVLSLDYPLESVSFSDVRTMNYNPQSIDVLENITNVTVTFYTNYPLLWKELFKKYNFTYYRSDTNILKFDYRGNNITINNYTVNGLIASGTGVSIKPNNPPVQTPIGSKTITAGMLLSFNVTATDADNDPITYGTNATHGYFNTRTGEYSWQTVGGDAGTYYWYFNSSDNYGAIASETIKVTVTAQPVYDYIPEVPGNLHTSQGNFWINYSWEPGIGNKTDSYNVSIKSLWTNGTTSAYNNTPVLPHGWSNITVWAYNNSGSGSLSSTPAYRNTRLANNPPVQTLIGNKTITAGDILSFNVQATDADSDPITYGSNASHGTLNVSTGAYSWTTTGLDVGTYTWYFNSSDNYGGVASETITATVNAAAPVSQTVTLVANSAGNTGFSAQTTGENQYSSSVSNSQVKVSTQTTLSTTNLNALSVVDVSYATITGTASLDAIMVVNFTLSNVHSVNWVSLKFVGAVTGQSEPLIIGLYNATSPSGGGWTKLNTTTPATGNYITMTYNVTSQVDKNKYMVLNGSKLTFSFAEWVNGPNNAGLSNDLYQATINYQ